MKGVLYGGVLFLTVAGIIFLIDIEEKNIIESQTNSEWNLVWEDEFDGDQLDTSKWNYDIGNGFTTDDGTYVSGWGNQELQFYQKENVSVKDGKLIIEARKESVSDDHGVYNYTSGKIHTKGKFSQKYGKFEAKIKLPEGKGYWPAFWMMPEKDVYGGWAASGEIDIMEAGGSNPTKIGGAIHYGSQWPNNTYTAKDYHFPDGQSITEFNTYTVEWEPGEIRWYVNGQLFQKLNNWYSINSMNGEKFTYPAPFDQPFYLILNLAVGGWYDGEPDKNNVFPARMEVEYVKVYEKAEYHHASDSSS
ncbi:Glucan endo-1,3-beta-glucosidase A1 precursor [Anoxybacillus thermarum]|uniref:Glucan endo-1,3-beta-glucosidase A1 n=1 Tax=Anoxybacillus thermarum TaxID=404937 RepID=A0A0D0Q9A9_9BACL|nr:glycoside hydrolase family 16 protein [Anoxybacillus thermarum]KIQ94573.1 Glucan endo-1,3-beta-glucosidase A1 precursor [Anoxybacillus thermarum]